MSISKAVGRCPLFALVAYLFVKGALIVVPRKMVAPVSALVVALVQACCGADGSTSVQTEAAAAVLAMDAPPVHDEQFMAGEGDGDAFLERHRGVVNAPSQGESLKRTSSCLSYH